MDCDEPERRSAAFRGGDGRALFTRLTKGKGNFQNAQQFFFFFFVLVSFIFHASRTFGEILKTSFQPPESPKRGHHVLIC